MTVKSEIVSTIRNIKARFENTLPDIKRDFDYTVEFGTVRYDGQGNFSFKVTCNKVGGLSKEAQAYEVIRQYNAGLPIINSWINIAGNDYQVIGLNRSGTRIMCLQGKNKKTYLVDVSVVKLAYLADKLKFSDKGLENDSN